MMPIAARWLLACLLALVAACLPAQASAPSPLRLDGTQAEVDAWPALRALPEAGAQLTLDEVRQRSVDFVQPQVPRANFGVQRGAMWLHLPLQATAEDGRWVLQIDYAPLNRVDVYQLSDGHLVLQRVLGNAQPFGQRPLPSRAHALALDLPAGGQHELYLRVQTQSSMLVPITLYRPAAFWAQESGMQMLQGLATGLALAMLLYSLAYWLSLRDALFAHYALMLLGVASFFVAYFGIGQQYLWPANGGLMPKLAPLAVLLALVAGTRFVRAAVLDPQRNPWLYGAQGGVSMVALVAMLASVAGLLDYRQTQAIATLLGPTPMLLSVSEAWRRARAHDRVARYMLAGWVVYAAGALTAAGLLRGLVPANFWTQHVFQFSSLLEMVMWLRVLGVHIEIVRREAERTVLEKEALVSLAHTDALTGLPNRRGLSLALAQALPLARADSALALYLIDLDGFKPVNDRLGHDAGDELLVQVGQRLRASVRGSDALARIGGDEFVIMAAGLPGAADAQRVGEKLLRAFDAPFQIAGQACRVGLTIGFVLAPQDGLEAADLLKQADAAMYAGKQAGRHALRRYGADAAAAASGVLTGPLPLKRSSAR